MKISLITISIITGFVNFIILGFALALSSGGPEIEFNELLAHFIIWTSLFHALISSWLFITLKRIGSVLGIFTSIIASIGPIMIMKDGISILWISITICFVVTITLHIKNLITNNQLKTATNNS
ncbi:MAG TPA: hypothetical protein VKZ45_09860 [Vicingaceae bacterium]|nr:hypothetical protein [Vicingaceae bacterium]